MRIRYFNVCLATLLSLLSSCLVNADGQGEFFLRDMLDASKVELPSQKPEWLKTPPTKLDPVLEGLLRQENAALNGDNGNLQATLSKAAGVKQGRWIFVSLSMPEAEIKAAARAATQNKAILVFRGIAKDQDIRSISLPLLPIVKDIKPVPAAMIDPSLFTRFAVTSVPTVIEVNDKGEVRQAHGLLGFEWLASQEPGDLGQRGSVYEIAEPDMIEEIKRRIKAYDWETERKNALAHFWERRTDEVKLPDATANSDRRIDPSIVSTRDISTPDGKVIAVRGQKINPQKMLPMRHVYIVFNAANKAQAAFAKKLGEEKLKNHKPVVFMFTEVDVSRGWEGFNETQENLEGPVYRLPKNIAEKFQLQAVPSMIEGDGELIKVSEFKL